MTNADLPMQNCTPEHRKHCRERLVKKTMAELRFLQKIITMNIELLHDTERLISQQTFYNMVTEAVARKCYG